jgi:hypothetical protein
MYIKTNDLPQVIRQTLKNRGYGKADIRVMQLLEVSPLGMGGAGQRDYCVVIDLANNSVVKELTGSWGGANMFTKNQVDSDNTRYPIPINGAVILGSEGYRSHATLVLRPENATQYLTADNATDREKEILNCFKSYTSAYRKECFRNMKVGEGEFRDLESKGYIKIAKNGAMRITTEGKNIS